MAAEGSASETVEVDSAVLVGLGEGEAAAAGSGLAAKEHWGSEAAAGWD